MKHCGPTLYGIRGGQERSHDAVISTAYLVVSNLKESGSGDLAAGRIECW